ncbi:MAG: hypothetical protein ACYCSP_02675 [Acidobacteriaceae bacterium]
MAHRKLLERISHRRSRSGKVSRGWGLAGINIDNDGWIDLTNPFRRDLATPNAC